MGRHSLSERTKSTNLNESVHLMETTQILMIMATIMAVLGSIYFVVRKQSGRHPSREFSPAFDEMLRRQTDLIRDELERASETSEKSAVRLRKEVNESLASGNHSVSQSLTESNQVLLKSLHETTRAISGGIDKQLVELRASNEMKLDQMRATVDEKLTGTLDRRIGSAFKQVSDRLESVQQGLGEMRQMAEDVGDFKRVLTNVKTRGTWGEVQLKELLSDMLVDSQWEANVKTRPNSDAQVEFAIKLPGSGQREQIWLPVDSKFPQEDYLRMLEAQDRSDHTEVENSRKKLENAVIKAAGDIQDKYLEPPYTTDFGVLFLPTEGLYAEVLRRPRVFDKLQSMKICLAGPTTFCALLNSLQMGFRTLAIQRRSSEVWDVLAAVKAEFGKFGDVLEKLRRQLDTAQKTITETGTRTRQMNRKPKDVETIPSDESATILGLSSLSGEDVDSEWEVG